MIKNIESTVSRLATLPQLFTNLRFAMQAEGQLWELPGTRKEIRKNVHRKMLSNTKDVSEPRRSASSRCDCSVVRRARTSWAGPFNFTADLKAARTVHCPHYKLHGKSWSWSISAQMLPVLQFAVRITFGATLGAAGHTVGTSLKYFGIVQRSKSPAFQLFDRLPDRCARKCYNSHPTAHGGQFWHVDYYNPCIPRSPFFFEWDLELVKTDLSHVCRDLSILLADGYMTAAACSDEHGNTLLHVSK